jgi:hypothetical protein
LEIVTFADLIIKVAVPILISAKPLAIVYLSPDILQKRPSCL